MPAFPIDVYKIGHIGLRYAVVKITKAPAKQRLKLSLPKTDPFQDEESKNQQKTGRSSNARKKINLCPSQLARKLKAAPGLWA